MDARLRRDVGGQAAGLAHLLRQPATSALDAPLDRSIVEAAAEHGIAPLLYVALRDAGRLDAQPLEVRDGLARIAREEGLLEQCRRPHLDLVLAALASAGVRPIIFKGGALAYTHYPEPWLRPRIDVDLLVRDADADRTARVLEGVGCRRAIRPTGGHVTHQFTYFATAGGTNVAYDVHWRVADPHVFAGMLRFDEIDRAAIAVPPPGPGVRTPSPVHALFIACIHRVAHHYDADTLVRVVDIDHLARRFDENDWARFADLAVATRARTVCGRGLDLAREWLDTPVPPAVVAALRRDDSEPSAAYLKPGLSKFDILRSDLWALPSWRARATLVREHLFPSTTYVAHSRHSSPTVGLPIRYLIRIARGAAAWFRPLR